MSQIDLCRCGRAGCDTRNKLGTRLISGAKHAPFKGLLRKMGNKLSCSCGPLKIKGYRLDGQGGRQCNSVDVIDRFEGTFHEKVVIFFSP